MEVINLNFIPSGANPVAHASQFDEGRTTRFNLFDGSAVYTLDGTEIITVSVRKPDGHIVTEAVTNTSDSYVEVVTTEQMTACAGDNLAQIKVEKGGDTIGFLNYILQVQKDPEDGGDPSESFIHDLNQQIADAVADQYDAADVVFDAVPTAGHGVGFAVTSEGVKNAIPDDLDDLSDVTYTGTPAMGEAVVWDGSKWTNGTPDMDVSDLADVTITTPSDDDILVYQNGEWVNMANPASTANFGADYDENTTYNTGDKCVYNNLLYECNDDGVTGAWDAAKWDSLTVASMTDNNLPHFSGTPTAGTTAEAIKAVENKIEYQAGDVIDISNTWCVGYQGNNTTRIFFIPLSKPLASGVNVAISATVSAYSFSGANETWNNNTLSSLGTITLTKTSSGVLVTVVMSTAVSTTLYTPLTIRIISGTLTLS